MARACAPACSRFCAIRTNSGVGSAPVPSMRWAMREGVFAITRRMRSTVASGPMPPMMPMTRCVVLESEVIDVAEQPDAASGVDENDVLPFFEHALAYQIQKSGHTLAGVDRIEKYPF